MRKLNGGVIAMAIGVCFLWNPPVGTWDILPDLIGFLLLYLGMTRFADLHDDLAEAQKAFRNMLWLGVGELVAFLVTEVLLKKSAVELNPYERPVWILVFTFVFLVLEWYFLIPAWRRFFKGFSELAEFHGGSKILAEKKGKTLCERMAKLSAIFIIAKTLCTLLPELFILTSFEHDAENPRVTFDWYTYVEAFRILAAILSAVVGIIWLISVLRFMMKARADHPWQEQLTALYEQEILTDRGLLWSRRIGTAFGFFRVGMIFFVDLALMYYEILPDWIAVLLFLCGALILGKLLGDLRIPAVVAAALLICGVLRTVLEFIYLEAHTPTDALHLPNAYSQYLPIQLLGVAEALLIFALIGLLILSLTRMATEQTAVVYEGDPVLSARATERMHAGIRKKSVIAMAFLFLATVSKMLECLLLENKFAWIWIVQVALTVATVILFSNFLAEISERMLEKYPSREHV